MEINIFLASFCRYNTSHHPICCIYHTCWEVETYTFWTRVVKNVFLLLTTPRFLTYNLNFIVDLRSFPVVPGKTYTHIMTHRTSRELFSSCRQGLDPILLVHKDGIILRRKPQKKQQSKQECKLRSTVKTNVNNKIHLWYRYKYKYIHILAIRPEKNARYAHSTKNKTTNKEHLHFVYYMQNVY